MSTPPYLPPFTGPSGLTVSNYQSILADNLQSFLNIYGQNQYIGKDSAIYQLLSIISLKQADTNLGLQLAYNQASPQTAVGAGLDRVLKMNGLARLPFSYSEVPVVCTGTAGTVLTNCFAQDQVGNLWALPASVTITGGSVTVTASCTTPGNVAAEPGDVSIIATPVAGWASVSNATAATPGDAVETDSQVRARQAISVALPALTPIAATVASVLTVTGVTRVAPGYPTPGGPGTSIENPTGATDSWGNPAHSITLVVEGGNTQAIANALYAKKTIGCFTNGTTSAIVTDPNTGYQETISFYQPPTYIQPWIGIYVQGLYGFNPSVVGLIQAAVVNYLNSLAIGEEIVYSSLYGAAVSVMPNPTQPQFSIKSLTLDVTAGGLFTVVRITGSAGTGYVAGDTLSVGGTGVGGAVTVASVSGSGQVLTISPRVVTPGYSYTVANNVVTSGGTGTGCYVDITAIQPTATTDIALLFYQAAQGLTAQVAVAAI